MQSDLWDSWKETSFKNLPWLQVLSAINSKSRYICPTKLRCTLLYQGPQLTGDSYRSFIIRHIWQST